jgi:hypothetical protein
MKQALKNLANGLVSIFYYLTLTPSRKGKKWTFYVEEQGKRFWEEIDEPEQDIRGYWGC